MASGWIGSLVNAAIITGSGVLVSIVSAIAIASARFGSLQTRVTTLEHAQDRMATKDDLTSIKESLAEIKGMFRLELKDVGK
jgi:hypothetical protein